jgi:hypothetical protein
MNAEQLVGSNGRSDRGFKNKTRGRRVFKKRRSQVGLSVVNIDSTDSDIQETLESILKEVQLDIEEDGSSNVYDQIGLLSSVKSSIFELAPVHTCSTDCPYYPLCDSYLASHNLYVPAALAQSCPTYLPPHIDLTCTEPDSDLDFPFFSFPHVPTEEPNLPHTDDSTPITCPAPPPKLPKLATLDGCRIINMDCLASMVMQTSCHAALCNTARTSDLGGGNALIFGSRT